MCGSVRSPRDRMCACSTRWFSFCSLVFADCDFNSKRFNVFIVACAKSCHSFNSFVCCCWPGISSCFFSVRGLAVFCSLFCCFCVIFSLFTGVSVFFSWPLFLVSFGCSGLRFTCYLAPVSHMYECTSRYASRHGVQLQQTMPCSWAVGLQPHAARFSGESISWQVSEIKMHMH